MQNYHTLPILSLLIFCFATMINNSASIPLPQFYNTRTKQFTTMNAVITQMLQNDITFVGENHDHIAGHKMEFTLLTNFYTNLTANYPQAKFAVSLEMIERDVAAYLQGYLLDQMSESWYLQNSRPWSNYMTDYKPLVDYVRNLKRPESATVIAANIPRRYAAFVAQGKEDVIFQMPDVELSYMADKIIAPHDQYYKNFYEFMKPSGWSDDKIEKYYRAQCIKDDTMAKSIVEYYNTTVGNGDGRIISYTGSFHVDYHLGLYNKVQMALPEKRLLLISIVPVDPSKPINPSDYETLADIVIFAEQNPSSNE